VLPLDFMDVEVKGQRMEGLYRFDAQTRIYQAHGFSRNCWDRAVQFRDELIQKDRFPNDSGFTVQYPFHLEGFEKLPALEAVVERGDRYEVKVNGRLIQRKEGDWWLDRSFYRYVIDPEHLRPGRNVIETTARPFSIHHEPEPVYLLGRFALKSADQGWIVSPARPLKPGPWSPQGRPFYSGAVTYTQRVECRPGRQRFFISLSDWKGVAARIDVNGSTAGYLGWPPWRLEITDGIREGSNTVSVVVYGSLKNLLGPHHRGAVRGSAWPGSFLHGMDGQPPGDKYDVIPYGLYKPFRIWIED
jgi:hypothetical protein